MSDLNLYKAYTDDTVLNSNPLGLVLALYEGALDSIRLAKNCFETGDIAGRAKAINRAFAIVTELTSSLDHEKGGDVSKNLATVYDYVQRRILNAHLHKNPKALVEAENLLTTMLDGWKGASSSGSGVNFQVSAIALPSVTAVQTTYEYSNYFADYADSCGTAAYSF